MDLPVGADGRTSSENGTPLQYDANGRLTQDASFNYLWNDLGQLAEVRNKSDNALRASYQYDATGRRIARTLDGQTTKYLHDGANPIQLQDAAGTPTANLLAGGIDEWFASTSGGQTKHFLTDALGSTLRLTDHTGAKLVDYTYDPYGGTTNDNPSHGNANPFQYTGRENDGNGLYYYRARFLKTGWGRFISPDPIGLRGGQNVYAYVEGSPLLLTDPFGLCPGQDCEKADDECYEECKGKLGKGGRTNQGFPYRNCWVNCMARKGCREIIDPLPDLKSSPEEKPKVAPSSPSTPLPPLPKPEPAWIAPFIFIFFLVFAS